MEACHAAEEIDMQNVLEYTVGWFTLALINAGLAQGKNRSGLAWFLASLLLGPLATLLVVLSDKKRPWSPRVGGMLSRRGASGKHADL